MANWFLVEYWPWWLSAFGFATVTRGMWVVERRLLGVSGLYAEALRPRTVAERELERADPRAVDEALMKATLAEFGPEAVAALEETMASAPAPAPAPIQAVSPVPRGAHITFLVMLALGGLGSALLRGAWALRTEIEPAHAAMIGEGAGGLLVLVLGGVLVGFGTRMAGGCSSGHGLSGCSRLQPGSLLSTAGFFGVAVAVSFLLDAFS